MTIDTWTLIALIVLAVLVGMGLAIAGSRRP